MFTIGFSRSLIQFRYLYMRHLAFLWNRQSMIAYENILGKQGTAVPTRAYLLGNIPTPLTISMKLAALLRS